MKCETCEQELPENGYTSRGCLVINCTHDGRRFDIEVRRQREFLTLVMIDKISKNELPHDFEPERATLVALATLLVSAMEQLEAFARAAGDQTQH